MSIPSSAGDGDRVSEPPTCLACDRSPAAQFHVRRHVGMVLSHRVYRFRGPLCAEHGSALARECLNRTLVRGWWGISSFFLNIYTVCVDLAALARARRLGPPEGIPRQPLRPVEATNPNPRPKAKPLFDV